MNGEVPVTIHRVTNLDLWVGDHHWPFADKRRAEIDAFRPTVIVAPMFEGGHVHHDMTVGLLDRIVTERDEFKVYEAPEYTPLVSLFWTPHRVLTLCLRWLGLVSYYGPPDGIDDRKVLVFRLDADEIALRKRMLACFVSQNAPSLVATRGYPDRLVDWQRDPERRTAFQVDGSFLGFVLAARKKLPASMVDRLLPVQRVIYPRFLVQHEEHHSQMLEE